MRIKSIIKEMLKGHKQLYFLANHINNAIMINAAWERHCSELFRKECYEKYYLGGWIVHKTYGDIEVIYKAVSPKNLWHLSISSLYEDAFMADIFSKLKDGDVVLDIGAHTGMYTIPLAKAIGSSGKVYAFEPEKKGQEAIKANVALNGLSNVELMPIAVVDSKSYPDHEITLYTRPDKDTHSIFEPTIIDIAGEYTYIPMESQQATTVRAESIDNLMRTHEIKQPDFIKIDVEAAEFLVLEGMQQTLINTKMVLVEVHPDPFGIVPHDALKKNAWCKLALHGFELKWLDEYHLFGERN